MSSPPSEIGVEEPMFVCGAIAAMSAAIVITAPAESALDPGGDGIWRAVADSGYQAPNGMYGGWTAAIALNAVVASNDEPAKVPSAFTVNFVGRVDPGSDLVISTRRLG